MNVIVLGASGFLGKKLLVELSKEKHNILALSRKKPNLDLENVCWIESSLKNALESDAFSNFKPDTIINLAAGNHPRTSYLKEVEDLEEFVLPFFKILEYFYDFTKLLNVVFASSFGSIYTDGFSKEEKKYSDTSYMATKVAVENYLSVFAKTRTNFTVSVLRISNPVGFIDKDGFGVVNIFSKKIINNENITLLGDYNVPKDYISVEDTVAAILSATGLVGGGFNLFNIHSGTCLTAQEIYRLLNSLNVDEALAPVCKELGLNNKNSEVVYIKALNWSPKDNIIKKLVEIFNHYEK